MDSTTFAKEMAAQVAAFCKQFADQPPAYSYIPLTDDAQRTKIMQARLWNEVRAAEVLGSWLKTTPERDVKAAMAESAHEEFKHAALLEEVLQDHGVESYDYQPVPAQAAMFNAFESQTGTVERMAAFSLAGEGVADFLIGLSLEATTAPEWVRSPYRAIHEDEEGHGSYPQEVLAKYASVPESQARVRRAVAMSLVLRKEFFASLDRWVLQGKDW
jgi:1,2-phenylacetyl-CoA epoxidase catalytic subunit